MKKKSTAAIDIPEEKSIIEELFSNPIVLEVAGPKLVQVIPKKDFQNTIGGTRYICYKGVPQKVTEYIKQVWLRDPTKIER